MKPDLLVVVPMKDPRLSKTRLNGVIDSSGRAELARQLFDRTINVLTIMRDQATRIKFDIAVVTGSDEIKTRARSHNVLTISEQENTNLNGALSDAAGFAKRTGYSRVCVLPADLAMPDPHDIWKLLHQELGEEAVILCPSRDFGTNALYVTPPDVIEFAYGPGSFFTHCKQAEKLGITPIILLLESLRWDIDSSSDLVEFLDKSGTLSDSEAEL
ncbi:MAG: 2-phospho-L-lactate guanylyltransferase [Pseudomonadota bacterium]